MAFPDPILLHLVRDGRLPAGAFVSVELIESAIDHRVAALLDDAVRRQGMEIEDDARLLLAMYSLEVSALTEASLSALTILLDACRGVEIGITLFKGHAIGLRWYGSPSLRPSADIDVFINPDDIERTGHLVAMFDAMAESQSMIADLVASGAVFEHTIPIGETWVDLHSDPMNLLVPSSKKDLVWSRASWMSFGDGARSARVLDLETSMVQALINLLRDGFPDLLHINDIRLMMDADPDWDFIDWLTDVEGWTDLVRYSLTQVSEILERESPLPRSAGLENRALLAGLWPARSVLKGSEVKRGDAYRQLMVSLGVVGRRREVIRAMAKRAFPSRSKLRHRLALSEPDIAMRPRNCGAGETSPAGGTGSHHTTEHVSYPLALYRWRRSLRRSSSSKRTG